MVLDTWLYKIQYGSIINTLDIITQKLRRNDAYA